MRCMACGAEMILTNVVQDETMAVPGFEHQTFMCSECHDVERRFVFTKQDRDGDSEPMPEQAEPSPVPASTVHEEQAAAPDLLTRPIELAENVSVEPTQTEPVEPTIQNRDPEPVLQHAAPPVLPASTAQDKHVVPSGLLSNAQDPTQPVSVEPTQTAPVEAAQAASVETAAPVQATETVAVETTQTAPVQPTIQTHHRVRLQTNVWAKTLVEKVHRLKQRVTAPREAADETERHAEFNRFWDNLLSVSSPLTSSDALSHVKPDEPLRSPAEPIASLAPTARDRPIAPASKA
jgi:hypothetical protein